MKMWTKAVLVFIFFGGTNAAKTTVNLNCEPTIKPGLCILKSIKIQAKDVIESTTSSSSEKVIKFESSQLEYLPEVLFKQFPRLEFLSADNVGLKKLTANIFAKSTSLIQLDISSNFVDALPENAFGTCNNLEIINMAANRLHIFNSIEIIGCNQLRHLNVSSNQLIYMNWDPLNDLRHLEQIDLNDNLLTELIIPKYLRRITIRHNHIHQLDTNRDSFIFLLEHLDASKNRLSDISALSRLAKLTYIDLSYNRLVSVDFALFRNMRQLRDLRLAHNNIFAVSTSDLKTLSLELVDLSHNELTHLTANDSAGIGSVVKLLLNNNYLMSFELTDGSRNFPNLREISLNDNDWICEDIEKLVKVLKAKKITIKSDNQRCTSYQIIKDQVCCRDLGTTFDELVLLKSEKIAEIQRNSARTGQQSETVKSLDAEAPNEVQKIASSVQVSATDKDLRSRLMTAESRLTIMEQERNTLQSLLTKAQQDISLTSERLRRCLSAFNQRTGQTVIVD
ncbi:protein flightless-1-like [Malaya genurostris]|uniref:protein flightless-1-like n=1 Tax=Malaya genurostris TaxID=325434 RepID=UPI0026F3C44E|nr:protein flightless-1-like [Malaya genurostris]